MEQKTGKKRKLKLFSVTVDQKTGYVSIDGSKFKAWNGKDRNFTIMKLDDRIKWLEDHTNEYLCLIEEADKGEEAASGTLSREGLEEKLQEAQERLERYRSYRELMEKENLAQISLTDADARLMKNKNGMDMSYNVQTVSRRFSATKRLVSSSKTNMFSKTV